MEDLTINDEEVEAKAEENIKSSCFCEKIQCEIIDDPFSVSICHCTICRRLTGDESVDDKVEKLQTSKQVVRHRCKDCGSPVYATINNKMIAIPLSLFTPDVLKQSRWQVQHHLHYSNRIMDINDDLPKFENGAARGSGGNNKKKVKEESNDKR